MEFRRYFDLLLRWWWLIVLGTVVAAGSAYFFSRGSTPVYQASTTLLVDQSRQASTDYTSILTSERLSQTYVEWLRKRPVLEEVIQRLQLPVNAAVLASAISVTPVRDTQLLVISVENTDPARSAAIANMLPEVFREQSSAMQAQRFLEAKTSVENQRKQVRSDIEQTQAELTQAQAANNVAEVDRLRTMLEELQVSDANLAKSLADIRLEESKSTDSLFAIERAETPTRPIRPRTTQNTLLAAVVGAMLALGVVFLLEYLNDVLQSPDDIQTSLGLTVLAAVPEAADMTSGELTIGHWEQSAIGEAYRVLRTNLQFAAVGRPLRVLLVTSASPSEGKSITSANLAIALAQNGRRVILVDCDLRKPRLHRVLNLPNNVGLTIALVDAEVAPVSLLQECEVPGLRVLTSGPLPPNPAEILGTARMRELLAALAEQADILVVDSPPMLAVADAAILASQVDGVLLVVDAGKTRRGFAQQALLRLQQVQAPVVGVVLNRVPQRRSGYYYYYHHDYGDAKGSRRTGVGRRWPWQKGDRRRVSESAASKTADA